MFDYDPYAQLDPVPEFTVESDDLDPDLPLKAPQYSAEAGGSDTSPHLSWSEFPPGTKSFAVTAYDPDAPTGSGFWHWAVFNIPADVTSLPTGAGAPDSGLLPEGAITLPNELREPSFTGAAPPEGTGVHRYFFVVHAVDVPTLDVDAQSTPAVLGFNLRPLWLLPHPAPLQTVPEEWLGGPERISGGWWDGERVLRDYYIARLPEGQLAWIYRDNQQGWFVHGWFG